VFGPHGHKTARCDGRLKSSLTAADSVAHHRSDHGETGKHLDSHKRISSSLLETRWIDYQVFLHFDEVRWGVFELPHSSLK